MSSDEQRPESADQDAKVDASPTSNLGADAVQPADEPSAGGAESAPPDATGTEDHEVAAESTPAAAAEADHVGPESAVRGGDAGDDVEEYTHEDGEADETDAMMDLVELLARALVDRPDDVEVSALEDDEETVLELSVDRDDLGKVIGKRGITARAMRTILGAAARDSNERYVLEILD